MTQNFCSTSFRAMSGDQRGAVLVVGLIFLALLSLMGAVAYSVATQEERMAGNTQDRIRATAAAEAALRACEVQVAAATAPTYTATGTGGFFLQAALGDLPVWTTVNWNQSTATSVYEVTDGAITDGLARRPRCIAEKLDATFELVGGSVEMGATKISFDGFRITSSGVGRNINTEVVLQSTMVR